MSKKLWMMMVVCFCMMSMIWAKVIFSDVSVEHWAYGFIEKMQNSNVINGYPDNTFQPEARVKNGRVYKNGFYDGVA